MFNMLNVKCMGVLSMVEYKNKSYYRIHIETGNTTLFTITNYENLVYYYLRLYEADNYKECEACKIPIRKTTSNNKYCNECARKIKIEQTINNRLLKATES